MKRLFSFLLVSALVLGLTFPAAAAAPDVPENAARSYVLMESETGEVLSERNAHTAYPPASVTKIMTMLLVAEAVDAGQYALDDKVTASEYASSMGGSQIWLEPGEVFPVSELLKTVAVVSANDSAVALAEFTAGSEAAFVEAMNAKASYLGMTDTHFENCTGLPAEGHVTSAYDIALMSRELMKHEWITDYTTVWMDSIREGTSELTNTNRLIRTYPGATGLKTGFTNEAKYCLSATATRNGLSLVACVMGGETSALRFEAAKVLLDYGFANYEMADLLENDGAFPESLPVVNGESDRVGLDVTALGRVLVLKSARKELRYAFDLPEKLAAPLREGEPVGMFYIYQGKKLLSSAPILATESVKGQSYMDVLRMLLGKLSFGK